MSRFAVLAFLGGCGTLLALSGEVPYTVEAEIAWTAIHQDFLGNHSSTPCPHGTRSLSKCHSELWLNETDVTAAGVAKLKAALPDCDIVGP